jgi:hypothetical protein
MWQQNYYFPMILFGYFAHFEAKAASWEAGGRSYGE